MSIFCKELNKEFADKKARNLALKKDAARIIGIKKATVKNSDPVLYVSKSGAKKADIATDEDDAIVGSYIYPVINTTNFLDSHGDVHIDGIWDVSIKQQKNKLYYLIDHYMAISNVIAYPDDVVASVSTLNWSDLGQPYVGTTQALIFKVLLQDYANDAALGAIAAKKPIQNSVRMRYISVTLCIDDTSDDFKQEYANFYKYLAVIANKDDAIEAGYFWAITEASIEKEGSAVLFGSNEATPILYSDPGSTSQSNNKNRPAESSQKSSIHNLI